MKIGITLGGILMVVIIAIAVLWAGGYIPLEKEMLTPTPIIIDTGDDAVKYPKFDVTPTAVTSGYNAFTAMNSAETRFTVPCWSNQTGHTIVEIDNSTFVDPRMTFDVTPIPFAGANADDLATIYFEVSNYDARVEASGATDTYRLLRKTSGNYQVNWSTDGAAADWYIKGTSTMLMTGSVTLYLDFDVLQASMSRMDDNDAIDMTITLHNTDWSWSQSFTVSFVSQFSWGA